MPGVADDAIALLRQRQILGIGIDTPALGSEPAAGWLVLENLTRLEQLPPVGTTLVIGVLKVQASPASPAMVRALIP
ncbi:MAG: hypothetical protein HC876_06810 [Chloroflexaceae bacterium]|nr:hypothetical protein [Chloroflexaceae bacterium]